MQVELWRLFREDKEKTTTKNVLYIYSFIFSSLGYLNHKCYCLGFSSVQLLNRVRLFATPWITAQQTSLSNHKLPEFTQTHVHGVCDAIQPSHPLSSPSPPAPNPSQHQGLSQWFNSLHEVAKILELQLQHQSFQWTPRTYLLQDGLVGSPCSPRDYSRAFSNTTVQKHPFLGAQLSSQSNSHIHTWPLEKP